MKRLLLLYALLFSLAGFGKPVYNRISFTSALKDTTSPNVIFFDDFNDNKNKWVISEGKEDITKISDGNYYITAVRHAAGEGLPIKINQRKDFEIETRIKIVSGEPKHKNYYSMLFWGREGMMGNYFTFSGDGFASVEFCDGKNQSSCITNSGSLKETDLNPNDYNVYTIRKKGNKYFFFINGNKFYEMPFAPFYGNLTGFGAGRKVTIAVDYLKVSYL